MVTIWKYPLEPGVTRLSLPSGFVVRSVGLDPATGDPAVWIEVDPEAPAMSSTEFVVYGTGHPHIDPPTCHHRARFVGTVWQGALVWHVYEWKYEPF